ncbi:MAG: hypothetical protein K2Q20_07905, partial [Phycisphaerales bacterium]|nr:hypothetical protein [Phycisphaerales bacterium]
MQISKLVPLASGWLVMCGLPIASHAQPCSPAPAWTQSATLPAQIAPRLSTAVSSETTRNRVVVYGGLAPFPAGPLNDTWIYDGSNWTLSPAGGPGPRVGHRLSFDPQRGVTVLFGGGTSIDQVSQTWEWNGTAWAQGPDATFSPRTGFALAYAGNGRTVLFGGTGLVNDVPTTFDETWVYDGTSWTLLSTAGSPPALETAAMTYDTARQRVVLFGGNDLDFTQFDQTWELNLATTPPTWTLSPATGPSARSFASMTFDPSTSRVLITGGIGGLGRAGDTWAYNGTAWTLVGSTAPVLGGEDAFSPIATYVPPSGPSRPLLVGWGPQTTFRLNNGGNWVSVETPIIPALRDYTLAYDSAGARTLMFGGANVVNGQVGALWSFNGSTWSFLTSTGPTGREFATLAYDTSRSRAVFFGGSSAAGNEGDTWIFASGAWSQLSGNGPSARRGQAMAYDPSRNLTVLYGGNSEDGPIGETWVLNNTTWTR